MGVLNVQRCNNSFFSEIYLSANVIISKFISLSLNINSSSFRICLNIPVSLFPNS